MTRDPSQPPFLTGERLVLRPLVAADATRDYLAWLNDAEVLRYRAPKALPTTMPQLRAWIASLPGRGDLVLAIRTKRGDRHVGNIALNTILWVHRSAELSIMLGAADARGRGYGREAIALLTAHGFASMGLNRIWAESPNPAFNRAVASLGWRREGLKREALLVDGKLVDVVCWSILAREWKKRGR
ncbi:MAG: GNAT family N-acetyltransferase [Alphaproteobacteria bacterium]|nr:GNAT family N-acetyltransferase [Alphaproteobacteria bacterium]